MCRLAGWASGTPTTLEAVLGSDGLARLSHLSTVHSHGWGAAWVDAAGEQHRQRSDRAAWTDPDFARFARETAGLAAVVHLRLGTPGYGSGLRNVHPFTDAGAAFAHNGAIQPPVLIERLQDPDSRRAPHSQTDSERYFLALQDELDRNGGSLAPAMDTVLDRMGEVGLTSSSLNAVRLDRDHLQVISCHDPAVELRGIEVWPVVPGTDVVWPAYFPLSRLEGPELCAMASSGIVEHEPGSRWTRLENDLVWSVALADLDSSTAAITRRVQPYAETRRSA